MSKPQLSKRKVIEQSLAALGMEATRAQIVDYAKEQHGVTISPAHASSTAAAIRREAKKSGKSLKIEKLASQSIAEPSPVVSSVASSNGKPAVGIASDLTTIQGLIEKFGEGELKELIDVLKK